MQHKVRKQLEKFVDNTNDVFLKDYGIKSISYLLEHSCTATMFIEFNNNSIETIEGDDNILAYIKQFV